MGSGPQRPSFAELINHHAEQAKLNNYKLSLAIGLLPGHIGFSAKQVERLRDGRQRPSTPGLITRLIEVLKLSDDEADELWFAAGMIPDDWDLETFRRAQLEHRRPRRGPRKNPDGTVSLHPSIRQG